MALVIGPNITEQAETSRIVPIEAKEPLDNDKFKMHKLNFEFEVIDRDLWDGMNERWNELSQKTLKMSKDPDFIMSDDEIREAREPLHVVAVPYLRNIGPLVDVNNQPLELTDAIKDALVKTPWLQPHIADGFIAVQKGLTVADYKKLKAKNS